MAHDANAVTRDHVQALERHGFGAAEIFDMVATVAARAFWTKIIEGLSTDSDVEPRPNDGLAEALTVGRSPTFVRRWRAEPSSRAASKPLRRPPS